MTTPFKVCDYVTKRKDALLCPNRQACTFAHSKEELDIWVHDREA